MGNVHNLLRPKRDITIGVFGLDGAGKSTLVDNLANEEIDDNPLPTVGYTCRRFSKGRYNIALTELGGGKDIRGIWPKYFAESHAIIYVVDGTSNEERLKESKEELRNLLIDQRMRCKPLLVLCNKFDKEESIGATALVRLFNLSELLQEAADNGPPIDPPKTRVWICTSLRTNGQDPRLKRALKWLLSVISKEWLTLSPRVQEDRGAELEQQERDRLERIEKRQQRRKEEERLEAIAAAEESGQPKEEEETDINPFQPISAVVANLENSSTHQPTTTGIVTVPSSPARTEEETPLPTKSTSELTKETRQSLNDVSSSLNSSDNEEPTLKSVSNVIEAGSSLPELTSGREVVDAPVSPTSPSSIAKSLESEEENIDEKYRKDSGISLREEGNIPSEMTTTGEKSQLTPDEPVDEPVTKKKKSKSVRVVRRLKNRNKTLPMTTDIDTTSLALRPPLMAPWITSDTTFPADNDSEDVKGVTIDETDKESIDNTKQESANEDNKNTTRLLPLTNHSTESASFTLPQDVLLSPMLGKPS